MNPIEIKREMTDEQKAKLVGDLLTGKVIYCNNCNNYHSPNPSSIFSISYSCCLRKLVTEIEIDMFIGTASTKQLDKMVGLSQQVTENTPNDR